MTLAAVIRRAQLAQQAYERRVPVQLILELSAPADVHASSPHGGSAESFETRAPGAENHSGATA